MSKLDSKTLIGFGKHASAYDFTTAPATFRHLRLEGANPFMPPEPTKFRRGHHHPANAAVEPRVGLLDVSKSYAVATNLKGLFGNNGAAITAADKTDCAELLEVALGNAGVDPAGAAATAVAADSDGDAMELGVSELARFPIGTVCRFQTSTGFHVRQVRARDGANGAGIVTLDRTFSGDVVDASTIIRFTRWFDDPATFEHVHGAFLVEDAMERLTFIGGMCKWVLNFGIGAIARLETEWQFTNITVEDPVPTAFSQPVVGSGLINGNNRLWLGNTPLYSTNMRVVGGGDVVERPSNSGPAGREGFTCQKGGERARTMLEVTWQRGPQNGEITKAVLAALQARNKNPGDLVDTFDLAFQIGNAAGALGYAVMPKAAPFKAEEVQDQGYRHVRCTFEAMGPASDSSLYPFEWHMG